MTPDRILIATAIDLMDRFTTYRHGCLEWQRALNNGYAVATIKQQRYYLHRIACWSEHGPPSEDKPNALHLCDNKRCVRPDHLYWGSDRDNMQDAWDRGPGRATVDSRTHCRKGHEINPDNTAITKQGWRRCRECRSDWEKARRLR
jgi:HNH endonuclease